MMDMQPQNEFLFATADEVRSDFTVFTEECLRDLAAKDSRCRYDEVTRQLWISIGAVNVDLISANLRPC